MKNEKWKMKNVGIIVKRFDIYNILYIYFNMNTTVKDLDSQERDHPLKMIEEYVNLQIIPVLEKNYGMRFHKNPNWKSISKSIEDLLLTSGWFSEIKDLKFQVTKIDFDPDNKISSILMFVSGDFIPNRKAANPGAYWKREITLILKIKKRKMWGTVYEWVEKETVLQMDLSVQWANEILGASQKALSDAMNKTRNYLSLAIRRKPFSGGLPWLGKRK